MKRQPPDIKKAVTNAETPTPQTPLLAQSALAKPRENPQETCGKENFTMRMWREGDAQDAPSPPFRAGGNARNASSGQKIYERADIRPGRAPGNAQHAPSLPLRAKGDARNAFCGKKRGKR